jgi:hypothetical protein
VRLATLFLLLRYCVLFPHRCYLFGTA